MPSRSASVRSCQRLAVCVLLGLLVSLDARGQPPTSRDLQLEVFINGEPTHLIGGFRQEPDGRLSIKARELRGLGLEPPGQPEDERMVNLAELDGLGVELDEPRQMLRLTAPERHRRALRWDLRGTINPREADPSAPIFGGVVNYVLFGSAVAHPARRELSFSGLSASVEARLFGPVGTLRQTAILGSTVTRDIDALRLETTYELTSRDRMLTARAGDVITGGLAWTRPIRIGGGQIQRDFGLRPDLVTSPLPVFAGSAAVPSTVDIYLNNARVGSRDLPSGPFAITGLPIHSGASDARLVIRDSSGRQTETRMALYATPELLQSGLWDFSLEAGYPRQNFGVISNSYGSHLVASGAMRRGMTDWLTLEAQMQAGGGLMNGGAGAVAKIGSLGVLSAAASFSRWQGATGAFGYAAFETQLGPLKLHASSRRSFGAYADLASVATPALTSEALRFGGGSLVSALSLRPPRAVDQVSIGAPLPRDLGFVSFNYVHADRDVADRGAAIRRERSHVVSAGWSGTFARDLSLFASLFGDVSRRGERGFLVGLSRPFGDTTVAAGASRSTQGPLQLYAEAYRHVTRDDHDLSMRARENRGDATGNRAADLTWRSGLAEASLAVRQAGSGAVASATVQGSLAIADGAVFAANRIDDAFAVVRVGAPNVSVLHQNRVVGRTRWDGRALVPNLRSNDGNLIEIDPRDLPLDAEAPRSSARVSPPRRQGAVIDFAVHAGLRAAEVILRGADGQPLPPGAPGRQTSSGEEFVVGHDGRSFLRRLQDDNPVEITLGERVCRARFPAPSAASTQPVIGPIPCL